MRKTKAIFNVLEFSINDNKIKTRNVLPYFRNEWNDKHKYAREEREKVKTKNDLKEWITRKSRYQFWARCEYEFLIGKWPFGSYRLRQDMKEFLKNNPSPDFNDINQSIDFENIIIHDMEKIDIHYQIMMNIDIITDILWNEFNIK